MLGTISLDAQGRASLTVGTLSVGQHTINVAYGGDSSHSPGTGQVAGIEIVAGNNSQTNPGPTVVSLRRYGYYAQTSYLVLTFSGPLVAASAQRVANYTLSEIGRGRRHGRPIKVGTATYDPATSTVTLTVMRPLDLHKHYRLTVNGTRPTGVCGLSGSLIYASQVGSPGSDYVATITYKNLAGPSSSLNDGPARTLGSVPTVPIAVLSQRAVDHLLEADVLHARGRHPRHN